MANRSQNASGKHKEVEQFKEYIDDEREENRLESLRHHYDQKESERNFHEKRSHNQKELEKRLTELEKEKQGNVGHCARPKKTGGSEDHNGLKVRLSYEITELENFLRNLKASGKQDSAQYVEFEGYLEELKQLEYELLELEASESQSSANYIELENHIRLYLGVVHKLRELQASGKQGSGYYVELQSQLQELQAQGRNLEGRANKSYKSGRGSTKYTDDRTRWGSTKYTDDRTSGGNTRYTDDETRWGSTRYTDNNSGGTRRTGDRSEISQLSREIKELEHQLQLLAQSGKENTKEHRELERRLSDLEEAYSRAEKRSYTTGEGTIYRSNNYTDLQSGTTRYTGNWDDNTTHTRSDRHSTKRNSGNGNDHREYKSILSKRKNHEDNNNREDSRHSKSHRHSSSGSDNRRSSGGSGHHHHHHQHGHCHRPTLTKPAEPVEKSATYPYPQEESYSYPSRRPTPIPEEDEYYSIQTPPRKPLLVENGCQMEPPPRKPLLVETSVQPTPPTLSYDSSLTKPFFEESSCQQTSTLSKDPSSRKPLLVESSCQPTPTTLSKDSSLTKPLFVESSCQPTSTVSKDSSSRRPLLVESSCQPTSTVSKDSSSRRPLLVESSCQPTQTSSIEPSWMSDKNVTVYPSCPSTPACVCEPPPTPKSEQSKSCKMVADKPVGASSTLLSSCFGFKTRRESGVESVQFEEPPPPCPVKPEVVDEAVSAAHFIDPRPKQCAPKPPPPPPPPPPKPIPSACPTRPPVKDQAASSLNFPDPPQQCPTIPPSIPSSSCSFLPEYVDQGVSAAHFPDPALKQCAPKPPVCAPKPPVCAPKPKPPDLCETPKSRHTMIDTAAGKSYEAMDTATGVSYPVLTRIKSIYDELDDDDDYDLFPDREEDLEALAPSEYPVSQKTKTKTVIEEKEVVTNPNLCPYCGTGVFVKKTSAAGYLAAILCFPCGLYCCLTQTCCYIVECTYCHATTEKSADDMKKSYSSPHIATRESLQDVRSIYEVEIEDSTDDGYSNKNQKGKRNTKDRDNRDSKARNDYDRNSNARDNYDRGSHSTKNYDRSSHSAKSYDRNSSTKNRSSRDDSSRNYKEERRDRDMWEKDRTVSRSDKERNDSDRKNLRFSK